MNGWIRQSLLRCFSFFRRARLDQELDEEMAAHLELAIADYMREGMSAEEARRQALIQFGGREQAKEEHRDMRGLPLLEVLLQDVRFALHMFRKNLGFTIVAVLTLALGIGANTALFSIVNGVLLNPLPYQQPERLVALYTRNAQFQHSSISYPNFLDWRRSNESFSDMAAFRASNFNLTGTGDAERLPANMISGAFFPILGVKPLAGRGFTEQEDQLGGAPVTLISEGFGKRKFGSALESVGKSINLNGTLYAIIGVIPGSFRYENSNFQNKGEVYVPLGQWNEPLFRDRRTGMGMDAVGRLKPGVSLEQANSDMSRLAGHLADVYPDSNKDSGVTLVPLKENVIGDIRPFLLVLLAAVGFVLLIACANVANLLLARSTGRTKEFAIRNALGASPGRMIRQLLTESVLLSLAGGGLGLLIAAGGTSAAIKALPDALPRAEEIQLDARVWVFTLGASLLVGILFGLVPALKTSRTQIRETLNEGGRAGIGGRQRTQSIFVAMEMALAVLLLVGAGLMIRSLANLWNTSPGFDTHNVIRFDLASSQPLGASPAAIQAAFRNLQDAIQTVPGVQAVALADGSSPMEGDSEVPLWLEGEEKPASQSDMKNALFYVTQPNYLDVMQIPLKRGRYISASDTEKSTPVVVIDEQFAKQYFGEKDPIGRHVNFGLLNISAEIVGIVGHVKQWGLDTDDSGHIQAQCYFSLTQMPDALMSNFDHGTSVVARTEGSPISVMNSISHAVEKVNSQIVVYGTETMGEVISNSLAAKRFAMVLLSVFAGLALVLSSIGIYGVISYVVGQRTREIGIRMALGAERGTVLRMVLGQAGKMVVLGVAIGMAAAIGLTRLIASMLYGVSPWDPLTLVGVAMLLAAVSLFASYIPARHATRVDPMIALRYE
jgi:predicted permease